MEKRVGLQSSSQAIEGKGLDQKVKGSDTERLSHHIGLVSRRKHDEIRPREVLAQATEPLRSPEAREEDVKKYEVGRSSGQEQEEGLSCVDAPHGHIMRVLQHHVPVQRPEHGIGLGDDGVKSLRRRWRTPLGRHHP